MSDATATNCALWRLANPEAPVDSGHAAVGAEELAVGDDPAEITFRVEVVAGAPDEELAVLTERRRGRVVQSSGGLIVGDQHAERGVAGLPRQLGAELRVDDGARVDQVEAAGRVEDLLAFEKERTQLAKEERKPPVDLDLRPVGLDLGEVGIHGEVGGQIRRHAVLDVEPDIRLHVALFESVVGELAELDGSGGRQDFEIPAHGQPPQLSDHSHLRHEAGDIARHRRPDDRFVFRLQRPADLKAPPMLTLAARRVPQALERNGHLGCPTVAHDRGAGLEQGVPRGVAPTTGRAATPTTAGQDRVALHAVGIDREAIGSLLVEECVEHDSDPVIAAGLVPVDAVRAHLGRVVVARVESEVQMVGIVSDADFGLLGGRCPLDRVRLGEVRDQHGVAPGDVVEAPVYRRWFVRSNRAYGRSPGDRKPTDASLRGRGRRRRCLVQHQSPAHGGGFVAVPPVPVTQPGLTAPDPVAVTRGGPKAPLRSRGGALCAPCVRLADGVADVVGEAILQDEEVVAIAVDLEGVRRCLALHVDQAGGQP